MTTARSNRIPTLVLAAGVLALAAADWMVLTSTADGPEEATVTDAPVPSTLPASAFLTGTHVVDRAVIEGLECTMVRDGALGYALKIHNPTDAAVMLNCDVQGWVTEGSRMGRMMPRARLTKTEPLQMQVRAGASMTHVLAFTDPVKAEPATADAKALAALQFRTVSFKVVESVPEMIAAADNAKLPPAKVLGELRLPAKDATAAGATTTNPAPLVSVTGGK